MQESNKIEIKPGVELKFRYGMAAPDSRPGFKGYHWGDVRVLSVRGQNVDLEQKQAGEWRNNGLVSSIPYLQHMQNEYEKQMGTKSKLSETKKTMKKSELRQIIREEIKKSLKENQDIIDFNQKKTLQLVQGSWTDTATYKVPLLKPISDREFIRQILQTYHGRNERVGDIKIDGNNVIYNVSWSIGD